MELKNKKLFYLLPYNQPKKSQILREVKKQTSKIKFENQNVKIIIYYACKKLQTIDYYLINNEFQYENRLNFHPVTRSLIFYKCRNLAILAKFLHCKS